MDIKDHPVHYFNLINCTVIYWTRQPNVLWKFHERLTHHILKNEDLFLKMVIQLSLIMIRDVISGINVTKSIIRKYY